MSDTRNLTEELAAAIDRIHFEAVEELTQAIAGSKLQHYAARGLGLFLREIASRIMLKRVQREAGLPSGTRKE